MLIKKDIEKLIESEKISISYKFSTSSQERGKEFEHEEYVDIQKDNSIGKKLFDENFFGDRLKITLGPIVKSLNYINIKSRKKYQYKNREGYYDLRENDGNFILKPQEIILVGSNERVKVKGGIAAYIFPRLSNVDAGILYIPSYIDPHWNGILQAVIYNISSCEQILSIGEGISICRFYETSHETSDNLLDKFANKSHHYGRSWDKILDADIDPFPVKKTHYKTVNNTTSKFFNWIEKKSELLNNTLKISAILSLAAISANVIKFITDLNEVSSLKSKLSKQEIIIKDNKSELSKILSSMPSKGTDNIIIKPGVRYIRHKIDIDRKINSDGIVLVKETQKYKGLEYIKSSILKNSSNKKNSILIEIFLNELNQDNSIKIEWIIF